VNCFSPGVAGDMRGRRRYPHERLILRQCFSKLSIA